MKRAFLIVLSLFPTLLMAQVEIKGIVKDNKGRPVPGAAITLVNTYDGAVADSTGRFSFTSAEKGNQQIQVTGTGYKEYTLAVVLDGKTPVTVSAVLKEQIDELKAVVVTAGSFAAGDSKRGAVLSSLDIATTGGANADISTALKTLPGTQQVANQEGLFVRGGTGYETKQFIDGTLVNNPYYSSTPDIASRGRFQPFLFKGMVFSTGGYSALYGQALSAALVMESIDLPEKTAASAGISPLFANLGIQVLSKDKKSSWGTSYSYTNVKAYFSLVKQTPDYFRTPVFHNGDANFRIKTKGGIIKYYTTFSHSDLGLRRVDIDSAYLKDAFGLTNANWYNNLSWRENLGGGWKMQLGAGYSYNKDDISQQVQDAANAPKAYDNSVYWMNNKNFVYRNKQEVAQARAVFEKRLPGINSIRFGSEYWYSHNPGNYKDTVFTSTDHYNALFAETNIYLTNDLAATIGGRLERSSVIDKMAVAPRAALAYKTGKGAQMSFAYGIFFQKPEDSQLRYHANLGFTKATHYILNYTKSTALRLLRLEAYYKKYDHLVKTYPTLTNKGNGYAQGVELFWRDRQTIKNLDYWISYSYLDTKRDYLNYPGELQPNFAANHTASIVTKRFVTSIKTGFNLTYSFATGRPYYNIMLDNTGSKYQLADQGKTKPYQSLGFSANYVPQAGKVNSKTFLVIMASVTNVLGNEQVSGYNYSFNGSVKQAILPPAKRFFLIGLFLSWGVDKSDDIINNNL
ncbi:TonB-dependent Receptor Plug Domain [Filimonas lacunae]|uniref:TonB-dependent Receptor Plug Domain n=1 Tax=Filimonas lacunae TaxID=477680 RepID=A0A173MNT3_9BACT|nr:TonB-dependent receptor [Filimonas lacunae]BAV09156.1 outer membrane receptor protein [Filimonas lacunae]SIS68111.1 TonB-dependent Receptor Plug Domain [Filimonas lacunae]